MVTLRMFLVAIMTCFVVSNTTIAQQQVAATESTTLSAAELGKLLIGNTLRTSDWAQVYKSDGKIVGTYFPLQSATYRGKYELGPDGSLCNSFTNSRHDWCGVAKRNADGTLSFLDKRDPGRILHTVKVEEGDRHNDR